MTVPLILCFGLGLFVFSMAAHVLIWRCVLIKNQPAWLAAVFLVLPLFAVTFLAVASSRWSWEALALAYLMDLALSLSYMNLYTGIAGFSPSIAILERVEKSMPLGLPREELVPHWFSHERLAGARHDNLVNRRLVSGSGGVLRLLPRGRFIARCFLIFRRFLGLPDLAEG